jgi:HAE1 family hydrophobic/amphiphilic exporter-1
MGTAVIGGMLAASVIGIFLIPVSFYVVERLSHGRQENPIPAQQPIPATK